MQKNRKTHPSKTLAKSMVIFRDFLDAFPVKECNKQCWELITAAFGSNEADGWSAKQRSDMLFLYKQLKTLIKTVNTLTREYNIQPIVTKKR